MGRHHTRQHFECSFLPGIELNVDASEGYTDRTAGSKEECCNTCGLKAGCQDFVFEPSSGTCVLLPHVPKEMITSAKNEYTVSGSLQITVVKKNEEVHGSCDFLASSGYSGGGLGVGQPLPGGHAIESKQDCCDSCDRNEKCAKFTYETYSKSCMLYEAYAEQYITDGLLSGVVTSRSSKAIQAPVTHYSSDVDDQPMWLRLPPPPTPPMLWGFQEDDKPPPPPAERDATKELLSVVSLAAGGLMAFAFLMCAYCFFHEDVIRLVSAITGGGGKKRNGKVYSAAHDRYNKELPPSRGARGKKKRHKEGREGRMHVRVETKALTQKKDVFVGGCESVGELKKVVFEEFSTILASRRVESMLLLCIEAAVDGGNDEETNEQPWMLVTNQSDVRQVLECESLRLVEKGEHAGEDYPLAFVEPVSRKGKKGKKPKRRVAESESESGSDATDEGA